MKGKGKNLGSIFVKRGGGGLNDLRFRSWRSDRGEGATQPPKIFNVFFLVTLGP